MLRRYLLTPIIWICIIIAGALAVERYDNRHKIHEQGWGMAHAIEHQGTEWLAEAQMNQRIRIQRVILTRSFENKIIGVRVTLSSNEVFEPGYQNQLIQFLNHRALNQTGLSYQFIF